MIRFFGIIVAAAAMAEAEAEAAHLDRGLKRTGGNPQRANSFSSWFRKNTSPDTFTPTIAGSSQEASSSNDFMLACNNGELETNLYGEEFGEYADCVCDGNTLTISCAYGEPVCEDNFCTQEYYLWSFESIFGQFSFMARCLLCESGDCLTDTTVFDGNCDYMGFNGLDQPSTCATSYASLNFSSFCQAYLDCQICKTPGGFYGVAPTYTGCFSILDGSECLGDPYYYNPFPELRASVESKSNAGAIVGGIIGVLLFVLIGGGVYYVLHQGIPDRLLCKKRDTQTNQPGE